MVFCPTSSYGFLMPTANMHELLVGKLLGNYLSVALKSMQLNCRWSELLVSEGVRFYRDIAIDPEGGFV